MKRKREKEIGKERKRLEERERKGKRVEATVILNS